MTRPFWIITFIYAAGCHLSSPSPVSPLLVHVGQNISLNCNITSCPDIIWYLLRSEQLLPLLRLLKSKLRDEVAGSFYNVNTSRFNWARDQNSGLVSLEILSVEEEDASWYFCTGVFEGDVRVNRGIHLKVIGADSAGEKVWQPCWSLGSCILPAALALGFCALIGFYLCTGMLVGCRCKPLRQRSTFRVTEEEGLHYSSLRHPDKPRPLGRGGHGLVAEPVTYSTVTTRKHVTGLHENK